MNAMFGMGGLVAAAMASFLLCAFFRMMQLAITRSRTGRLREMGARSRSRRKYARLIRIHTGRYLFVCQSGFFLGALLLGLALGSIAYSALPAQWLEQSGSSKFLVLFLSVAIAAVLPLLGLQLCRTMAFNFPERTLLGLGFVFVWFTKAFFPVVDVLDRALAAVVRMLGLEYPCERQIAVPAEEIREIVEASGDAGEIEEEEKEMIKGVFLLSDTSVREIMTPRADVVSISIDSSLDELMRLFVAERLSRLLVIGESLDDVRGVVHAKDLLPIMGVPHPKFSIARIMRPACMVSGDRKVGDVLEQFRSQATHFAVVLDEHGGVDGVVTVEDLLEEIVGEIFDEFDSPADEVEVRQTKAGDFLIDGSMSMSDFNERFKAHLPEGEYDTIAGFVIHQLSRLPETGEIVECNRVRLKIEGIEQNRVTQLRVLKRRRPLRLADDTKDQQPILKESHTSEPKLDQFESKDFESIGVRRAGT